MGDAFEAWRRRVFPEADAKSNRSVCGIAPWNEGRIDTRKAVGADDVGFFRTGLLIVDVVRHKVGWVRNDRPLGSGIIWRSGRARRRCANEQQANEE